MKAFIVYWHPEPKSFNHAMFLGAQRALVDAGWEVKTSDLFAMGFDPVSSRANFQSVKDPDFLKLQIEEMHATEVDGFAPDLEREIQKIEWCDLMIWQFPLWWFGLPAVFKGWVDRTFAMGRTYGGGRIYEDGMFKGKRALLSLTTGGPAEAYAKDGFNGDIFAILRPIHRGMLEFTGFDVLAPQIVYAPVRMSEEQRTSEIDKYGQRLGAITRESPIEIGQY
ncbi:NAD(P)H-dependent oxidoreductase [Microbulbifer salipaludis]|uniref:NAD(P)H-dependent oxidoreductase n=1 Tax=Microbulbifer salipaludis TaxID=187980 RepID=A0ABS3E4F3_9GAMM|nr:NAD(P)H-dependent oxidoreductase [Microbulbifer salipaludis]MBN8430179.1 NAD(P)H-dependent oxidoreductase [Microbulbifer salipaludis]